MSQVSDRDDLHYDKTGFGIFGRNKNIETHFSVSATRKLVNMESIRIVARACLRLNNISSLRTLS